MIHASQAGAILGVHPNYSPAAVLRDMVRDHYGAPSEYEDTVVQQLEEFQQPAARFDFLAHTGMKIENAEPFNNRWLSCKPYGFVHSVKTWGIVKIKRPFHLRDAKSPDDLKPLEEQERYYAQLQLEMYLTGTKWATFYQWVPQAWRRDVITYDEKWIADNLPQLQLFYRTELAQALVSPGDHLNPKRKEFNNAKLRKLMEQLADVEVQMHNSQRLYQELVDQAGALVKSDRAIACGRRLTLSDVDETDYKTIIKKLLPDADISSYLSPLAKQWKLD